MSDIRFSMAMNCSPHLYLHRNRLLMQKTIRCSSVPTASESIQFNLKTYWTSLTREINHKLDEAVPVKHPNQIYEAMRHYVLAKGANRSPPVLCVTACELFGGNRRAAFPTACALEMVHAASLIHDDLLCMDDDATPNHRVIDENMALMAGDALLPLGFQHIVSHTPYDLVPQDRILRVITEIARAVGSTSMASGQLLDLEKKYGSMGESSAVCGGFLAGASDEEIAHLRRYGRAVGVLHRVIDDLAETEDAKKKNGKSYVSVYGVEKAKKVADDLRVQAKRELDCLDKYGDKVLPLYSFIDYAAHISIDVQV